MSLIRNGIVAASLCLSSAPVVAQTYVEAYGAIADKGDTQTAVANTLAIQAAIQHVSEHPGDAPVMFRSGAYYIASPLSITAPGVGLRGVSPWWPGGVSGTVIIQTTSNQDFVRITYPEPGQPNRPYVYGSYIENMAFTKNLAWAGGDTNTTGSGILVQGALGTRIQNVVVLGAYMGIHVMGSTNVAIQNCRIHRFAVPASAYSHGIYFEDYGNALNQSNWVNDTIISFDRSPDDAGNNYGLSYSGAIQDLTVRHLEVNSADYGVYIDKAPTSSKNYDIQLNELIIDQYHKYGLYLRGFSDGSPSIIGGWFAPAAVSGTQRAVFSNWSNGLRIQGVEFLKNGNYQNSDSEAIEIQHAVHGIISGNSFRNFQNAIDINASSNIVISNNSFMNPTGSVQNAGVLLKGSSNRVSTTSNTFGGGLKYGVSISSGCVLNVTGMNTWASSSGFIRFLDNQGGVSNIEANNIGQ